LGWVVGVELDPRGGAVYAWVEGEIHFCSVFARVSEDRTRGSLKAWEWELCPDLDAHCQLISDLTMYKKTRILPHSVILVPNTSGVSLNLGIDQTCRRRTLI
jgi:hypothetical protein